MKRNQKVIDEGRIQHAFAKAFEGEGYPRASKRKQLKSAKRKSKAPAKKPQVKEAAGATCPLCRLKTAAWPFCGETGMPHTVAAG